MILKDVLKAGDVVKIGFSAGSSFVYCGEVFDGIEAVLKNISDEEKMSHLFKRSTLERKLFKGEIKKDIMERTFKVFRTEFEGFMKDMKMGEDEFDKKIAAKFYETCEYIRKDEWQKDMESYDAVKKELRKSPFDMLHREVVEIRDSIDEKGVKLIVLDGDWTGKYWTVNECRKDEKMQKRIEDVLKRKKIMKGE